MGLFDFFRSKTRSKPANGHDFWFQSVANYSTDGDPMKCTAAYACIRSISFTISRLRSDVITVKNGKKARIDSDISRIFNRDPNPNQSAFNFKTILIRSLLTRGNAFAIFGSTADRRLTLTAIDPDDVSVYAEKQKDGSHKAFYAIGGEPVPSSRLLHIVAFPDQTGVIGMSTIQHFRKTIGIALQAESFGYNFFRNDATPGVVIKYPNPLKNADDAKRRIEEWNKTFGSGGQRKTALLDNGASIERLTLTNEDSQFIQTRQFQIEDIARIFGVPPHKIGHLIQATYGNMEQQNSDYIQDAIMPYVEIIEEAIEKKLLPDDHDFEFDTMSLTRGDLQARTAYYIAGTQNGWLSPNEVRQSEGGLDPYAGGDRYFRPMNLGAVNPDGNLQAPEKSETEPEPEGKDEEKKD